jgi:endonuclease/exonuclease/phosphatase family metal-dependent hydrolase
MTCYWRGFDFLANYDPGTLSRYDMTRLETERIGPWQEPLLALTALPNGRRIILANVRLAFPSIVVAVASFGSGLASDYGHRERIEQYQRLARLIEEAMRSHSTKSVVLAGDFNVPARLPSLDPLRGMPRDAWLQAGVGWGGTMTAEMPLSRIDQCWVSNDIDVVSARVVRTGQSDHRMLVVDLLVP